MKTVPLKLFPLLKEVKSRVLAAIKAGALSKFLSLFLLRSLLLLADNQGNETQKGPNDESRLSSALHGKLHDGSHLV